MSCLWSLGRGGGSVLLPRGVSGGGGTEHGGEPRPGEKGCRPNADPAAEPAPCCGDRRLPVAALQRPGRRDRQVVVRQLLRSGCEVCRRPRLLVGEPAVLRNLPR